MDPDVSHLHWCERQTAQAEVGLSIRNTPFLAEFISDVDSFCFTSIGTILEGDNGTIKRQPIEAKWRLYASVN